MHAGIAAIVRPSSDTGPAEADYNMFAFNGSTESLYAPHVAAFNTPTAMTAHAWVEFDDAAASYAVGGKASGSPTARSWYYYRNTSSQIVVSISNTGINQNVFTSTGTVANNTVAHVGFSYDGSNVKIYINGSLDSTHAYALGVYNTSEQIRIGAIETSGAPTLELKGSLTMFMVHNAALSDGDFSSLYNTGKTYYYETLPTSITDSVVFAPELSSRDDSGTDLSGNSDAVKLGSIAADGDLQTFAPYV